MTCSSIMINTPLRREALSWSIPGAGIRRVNWPLQAQRLSTNHCLFEALGELSGKLERQEATLPSATLKDRYTWRGHFFLGRSV